MRIGVISDTHDNVDRVKHAVSVFNEEGVSLVIHAGDYTSPFTLIPLEGLRAPFVGIYGNNDGDKLLLHERSGGRIHRQPYKFSFSGSEIIVMHEPDVVEELALSGRFDLIVYGHTHRPRIDRINNTLIVNPGEAGSWLYGKATVAVINIKEMDWDIVTLD